MKKTTNNIKATASANVSNGTASTSNISYNESLVAGQTYTINAEYLENDQYMRETGIGTLEIERIPTTTTISVKSSTTIGKTIQITITVKNSSNYPVTKGVVNLYDGNEIIQSNCTLINGRVKINFTPTTTGNHDIYAVYIDTTGEYNNSSSNHESITVNKLSSSIATTLSSIHANYYDTISITGTLNCSGGTVSGQTIKLLDYDNTVKQTTTTDSNGAFTFTYYCNSLNANGNDLTVSYEGTNTQEASTTTVRIYLDKRNSSILLNTGSSVSVHDGDTLTITGTLNCSGGTVSGQTIKLLYGSTVKQTTTTDSNGAFTFTYTYYCNRIIFEDETDYLTVSYEGTNTQNASTEVISLIFLRHDVTLTVADVTGRSGGAAVIAVNAVDENNNPVAEGEVEINITSGLKLENVGIITLSEAYIEGSDCGFELNVTNNGNYVTLGNPNYANHIWSFMVGNSQYDIELPIVCDSAEVSVNSHGLVFMGSDSDIGTLFDEDMSLNKFVVLNGNYSIDGGEYTWFSINTREQDIGDSEDIRNGQCSLQIDTWMSIYGTYVVETQYNSGGYYRYNSATTYSNLTLTRTLIPYVVEIPNSSESYLGLFSQEDITSYQNENMYVTDMLRITDNYNFAIYFDGEQQNVLHSLNGFDGINVSIVAEGDEEYSSLYADVQVTGTYVDINELEYDIDISAYL